jgi:D-alanyl-D-alanine carboxypeptidase/D-alanyl-D-alanine-endopeptidase (penicillin-binding protein 4)
MLTDSDNLSAECVLRLGTGVTSGVSAEDGLRRVAQYLDSLGYPKGTYRSVDGSGVSHYNLLAATMLVDILRDMLRTPPATRELFQGSLAIAGKTGTLSRRMNGTKAEGRILAKTGTVSGVSNLAGYACKDGEPRIAFAILCQRFVGTSNRAHALQDAICERLVRHVDAR